MAFSSLCAEKQDVSIAFNPRTPCRRKRPFVGNGHRSEWETVETLLQHPSRKNVQQTKDAERINQYKETPISEKQPVTCVATAQRVS